MFLECINNAPSNGVYPPRVLHGGVFGGTPLGSPEMYIFARARMGVCTESCQFVVPLGPAPHPLSGPGPSRPPKTELGTSEIVNFNLLFSFYSLALSVFFVSVVLGSFVS